MGRVNGLVPAGEQPVDVVLADGAGGELGAVQKAFFRICRVDVLGQMPVTDTMDFVAHRLHNRFDADVDMFERFDDFGNALTGYVLKIAGFENFGRAADESFVDFRRA